MPTHTPSPHRFLAPHPPSTQKSKTKPQSNLRHGVAVQTPKAVSPKPELQFKKITPAKRFVVTPVQNNINAQTPRNESEGTHTTWEDTHTRFTPRPKVARKFERVESIEEASQSSRPATQDDEPHDDIVQSIEQHGLFASDSDASAQASDNDELLFEPAHAHKRRRVSPPSPSNRRDTEPSTPAPVHNATSHRFKAPAPRTPAPFANAPVTAGPLTTPHRPHFILPPQPTSPPKPSKPLPEIFSPSRKIGKYLPNGLASTVTGWIIETANTGFAAQERSATGGVVWGREREDGVRLRLRVGDVSAGSEESVGEEVECFVGGVVFVGGEAEGGGRDGLRVASAVNEGGQTKVLLAGQGGARGAGGVRLRVGSVVGVRAPMWDIDAGGEKWVVGVDWVVL